MKDIRILVIDLQSSWRERFTPLLQRVGFSAYALEDYNSSTLQRYIDNVSPDLVIVGCVSIGAEEQALITQTLRQKRHLLIFCTNVSLQIMRSLFLQGVDDIADKTYDPDSFISTVKQIVEHIALAKMQ